MPIFPSEEWIRELAKVASASEELKKVGKDWNYGGIIAICEPDDKLKEKYIAYFLAEKGELKEARQISSEDEVQSQFSVSAPYSLWKKILRKEEDPMQAVMRGAVKVKGDMSLILKYAPFMMTFFNVLSKVETKFLDEK